MGEMKIKTIKSSDGEYIRVLVDSSDNIIGKLDDDGNIIPIAKDKTIRERFLELIFSPALWVAILAIPAACIGVFQITGVIDINDWFDHDTATPIAQVESPTPVVITTISEPEDKAPTQTPIIIIVTPKNRPTQTPFVIIATTNPLLPTSVIPTETTQSSFSYTIQGCFCTEYSVRDDPGSGCPGIVISTGFEIPASSILLPNNNNSIMYVYLNGGIADTEGVLFRYRTEMYGGGQPASRACVEDQFQWIKPERSPVYR